MQRWRGLKSLLQDAIEHGSRAVERAQIDTARMPFDLLEKIPELQVPVKGIRQIHDTAVSGVHGMIRLVNRVAGATLDVVIDAVEERQAEAKPTPPLPLQPPEPEGYPPPPGGLE